MCNCYSTRRQQNELGNGKSMKRWSWFKNITITFAISCIFFVELIHASGLRYDDGAARGTMGIKYKHHHLSIKSKIQKIQNDDSLELILRRIQRGGGKLPLEPNPNYVEYNEYLPPTLGDEESNYIRRDNTEFHYGNSNNSNPFQQQRHHHQQQQQYHRGFGNRNAMFQNHQSRVKPLQQVVGEFMSKLHISSPTIYYGIISSIIIFVTWQIPIFTNTLRNHFVCSKMNIINHHRYHTLLTAAISHNSISHLLMNLYGFFIFGRNVQPILKMNQLPLPLYCILSAFFSNLFFIQASPQGSCIGLSGVTLSLLALDAKLHPSKEIGFVIRFVPVRLPAQYALTGLLIWSLIGMAQVSNYDGVAHAVHFGGLLFGVLMYELLKRGIYMKVLRNVAKAWFEWKQMIRRINY